MLEQTNDQKILLEVADETNVTLKEAHKSITERFIDHRFSLLKDYNNLAVLVLGSAVTLITVAPSLIKTIWLFYVSSFFLVILIIINFMIQYLIFNYEEQLLINIEKYGQRLSNEITACKRYPDREENFNELDKTLEDSFKPLGTKKNWLANHGQLVTFLLFIVGFLGIVVSLIAEIAL